MNVQVLMAIDMVELQPGGAEGLELRTDLAPELAPDRWQKEEPKPGTHHVPVEFIPAQEADDLLIRQHVMPVDQDEMEADTQPRQAAGACHGVGCCGGADHQAGGG